MMMKLPLPIVFFSLIGFCTGLHIFRDDVPRFKSFEKPNHEVYLGDRVRLSCYALSKSDVAVKWIRNGNVVDTRRSANQTVRTSRFKESRKHMTLEIKKVEVTDQGLWTCRVSNQIGYITRNFTVEIIDFCNYFLNYGIHRSKVPIECICDWKNGVVQRTDIDSSKVDCSKHPRRKFRNNLEKFPCYEPPCDKDGYSKKNLKSMKKNQSYSTNVAIGIYREMEKEEADKIRAEQEGGDVYDDDDSAEVRSVEEMDKTLGDEDSFFGNFSGEVVIEKADLTEKPMVPPFFKDYEDVDKSVVSPAGRTVRLNCKAGGHPEPKVIWYKNDALVVSDSPRESGSDYRLRKWTLEMEDTTNGDSGKYLCEVWNDVGAVNRTFNLKIVNRMRSPPLIVPNILMNQTVNVNSTASFKCRVVSDLVPYIMWIRVELVDGQLTYYNETAKEKMFKYTEMDTVDHAIIENFHDESTLTLVNVTVEDQGIYACVTGNSLGTTVANATLFVNDFLDVEIPTGALEPEFSIWQIILMGLMIMVVSLLAGLLIAYFICSCYLEKKKEELETEALLVKRKKIVVTHKKPEPGEENDWDQPSYQIQIIEQATGNKKRRQRLSSDMTMLDDIEVDTDPTWEVDRERLKLVEVIGSGAFGEVWKAELKPTDEEASEGKAVMPVAVKKVKNSATEKDLVSLVGEMIMFKSIGQHDNLLRLIGCCSGVGPLYVLLELCELGNLRDFLRAHRPQEEKPVNKPMSYADYLEPRRNLHLPKTIIENLTQRHLVQFAWQIATGMEYMASRKIVHRDLAARNVLVAENFVMKISDFGLSRDVHYRDYYRKKGRERIPYKWMAIESLDDNQISTIESDVWSFGILLWEIMTLGGTPYPTIAMQQLYQCLRQGYRMEAPHNCPDEIYILMVSCWQEKREQRPAFAMIVNYLDWMLQQSEDNGPETEEIMSNKSTSSDDMHGNRTATPSDGEGTMSRKRKMRPLSAPVFLPTDPQHSICDEDEEPLTTIEQTNLAFPPMDLHIYNNGAHTTPRLIRQHTDPESVNPDYAEPIPVRHQPQSVAVSVDSAIGSPAWHITENPYSIPSFGLPHNNQEQPSYVNIRKESTRFPFNSHAIGEKLSKLSDSSECFGKTNQGFMPSPNPSKEEYKRRYSDESGRGDSSGFSSAEGLGGIGDFCRIERRQPPTRPPPPPPSDQVDHVENLIKSLNQRLPL